MRNVEIRQATLEDLDLLVRWRMVVLREVFGIPDDEPTDALEAENRRYYERALAAASHIACFAVSEQEVVGCGGICLQEELPSPDNPSGSCAYLMNIYTSPSCRKQGVGAAIVNWLIEQARQRGIGKIYLETSEAGRSLYEKLGFADLPDMMKLAPERPTGPASR